MPTPLTLVAETPSVLVAHSLLPACSVKELIAKAMKRTGQLNFAIRGTGSSQNLACQAIVSDAGFGAARTRPDAVQVVAPQES